LETVEDRDVVLLFSVFTNWQWYMAYHFPCPALDL